MLYRCKGCDNSCVIRLEGFTPVGCIHPHPKQAQWRIMPEPIVLIAPENEPYIPELFINGYKTGAYGEWGVQVSRAIMSSNPVGWWEFILSKAEQVDENGQVWRLQHDDEGLVKVPIGEKICVLG